VTSPQRGIIPAFFVQKSGAYIGAYKAGQKITLKVWHFQGKRAKKWHLQWDSNPFITLKHKKGHTRGHISLLFPAFGKAGN
jgi:glyoxylase-like metal-dependent hydrolase (beta-lactamase superfamily II)